MLIAEKLEVKHIHLLKTINKLLENLEVRKFPLKYDKKFIETEFEH